MPWPLYLALKQLFPTGRRAGSFFFWAALLGVALGVMVLVVVQSVMGGFGAVHRERIVQTTGHLEVNGSGRPFRPDPLWIEELRGTEAVTAVAPFANGFGMAQHRSASVFPLIYGLNPRQHGAFAVEEFLQQGDLADLGPDTAFISTTLAAQLGLGMGDYLELYSPVMLEALQAEEVRLPLEVQVAGIFEVEWNDQFAPGVVVELQTMQDFYNLGDAVHGLTIRLEEPSTLPREQAVAEALQAAAPFGLRVVTWRERWASFLWVLDFEKTMMLFLNLVIVAVAVFAIAVAQVLTVLRKTREIGLLGAMGARGGGIFAQYALQGLIIGVLGTVLGIVAALTLLHFRDTVIIGLANLTGTRETLVQFYYFTFLPVQYRPEDFVIISASAVVLATIAGCVPAWRAAALRPAEALRTEG